MNERVSSTGLPITWEWCKRHDWKSEKVVCPFCRADQFERERDEAKPVLEAARYQAMIHGSKIAYREACYQTELAISSFDAARAAEGGEDEPNK
jgi:hypothetical protein